MLICVCVWLRGVITSMFRSGQTKQEGSPPGANQEAKPKQEEGRESARPSRPAVSHARQTDTHSHSLSITEVSSVGIFYRPPLPFPAIHLVLHFCLCLLLFVLSFFRAIRKP